jgi:hypothetical protein
MNEQIRDNELHLKEQLQAISRPSNFSGLVIGTHPSVDLSNSKIYLAKAEWIVVSDEDGNSTALTITSPLVADMATSGANGIDTGSEASSTWYEIHVIRKPSDGSVALLLVQLSDVYAVVASAAVGATYQNLRDTSSQQKVAQGFKTTEDDIPFAFLQTRILKAGTPTGYIWLTIETDDGAGSPSGTAIATSPKIDVSTIDATAAADVVFWVNSSTINLQTGTQYHAVFNSDLSVSASNYLRIVANATSVYADGQVKTYNGTTWAGSATDLYFEVNARRAAVAPIMPSGYEQRCKVGYVRNNASANLTKFVAHDRTVTPAETAALASATVNTVGRTFSLGSFVPPVPVRVVCTILNAASTSFRLAPIIGGHGPIAYTPRSAGGQFITTVTGYLDSGIVNTDYSLIYASATVNGQSLWLSSWEWI